MAFKFANEIIDEIKTRGPTEMSIGSVSGEEFEEWLCTERRMNMKLNDYALIYYIHGNEPDSHEITKEGFKRGNSVEKLEAWAEENDIYDYMIYEALWVVERKYINPLKEIKRVSNIAADYVNSIVRTSESTLV